jgi:hypothetical protein
VTTGWAACAFFAFAFAGAAQTSVASDGADSRGCTLYISSGRSIQVRVDQAGLHFLAMNGRQSGMRLADYGYSGHVHPVRPAPLATNGGRIMIDHGLLTEWYRATDGGLEQGFTVAARPGPPSVDSKLRLRLKLTGGLVARSGDHGGIVFRGRDDSRLMRYGDLAATDARGRVLPARMRLAGGDIVLTLDDSGAVYPITIDPLFSAIRIIPYYSGSPSGFGSSIALNGNTVVVGIPLSHSERDGYGAVATFERGGRKGYWFPRSPRILGVGGHFGSAVGLEGDEIAVGAPRLDVGNASAAGSVYVFHSPYPTSAASADNVLTIPHTSGGEHLGRALALGDDLLVAGAAGAVYVYRRVGGGKFSSQLSQKLVPLNDGAVDTFGKAVALDGDTILVGAPTEDSGRVYIFTADANGTFSQSGEVKAPPKAAQFGEAVAIDTGTILIGAPKTSGTGAVYAYVQNQGAFKRSAVLKEASADGAAFGTSIAMDHGRAIVGSPGINKAFIYYGLSDGGAPKLAKTFQGRSGYTPFPEAHGLHFGASVAMDGTKAAVGADELGKKDIERIDHNGSAYIIEDGVDLSVELRRKTIHTDFGNKITVTATVVNHDPELKAHDVTLATYYNDPLPLNVFVSSSIDDCKQGGLDNFYKLTCDMGTVGPKMTRGPSITLEAVKGGFDFHVYALEADQNKDNNKASIAIEPSLSDPDGDSDGGGGALGLSWLICLAVARSLGGRNK